MKDTYRGSITCQVFLHKLLYFNLSFAGALYCLPFPDKETELQKFKLTKATDLESERPRRIQVSLISKSNLWLITPQFSFYFIFNQSYTYILIKLKKNSSLLSSPPSAFPTRPWQQFFDSFGDFFWYLSLYSKLHANIDTINFSVLSSHYAK